jgi:hypothetical protein
MKRLILAAGGLLLATANTPPSTTAGITPGGELDSVVAAEAPKGSKADSPATVKPARPKPARVAAAPAKEGGNGYPRCSASVQDRCAQGRSGGRSGHGAHQERRMQLAMRAGERG